MMAEALQECLSRFPKIDALKAQLIVLCEMKQNEMKSVLCEMKLCTLRNSKVKHWKLLSPVVTLLQFCRLVLEKA